MQRRAARPASSCGHCARFRSGHDTACPRVPMSEAARGGRAVLGVGHSPRWQLASCPVGGLRRRKHRRHGVAGAASPERAVRPRAARRRTVAVLLGVIVTFIFAAPPVARVRRHRRRAARRARRRHCSAVLAMAGPRLWRPAQGRIDRAFFRGACDARRILSSSHGTAVCDRSDARAPDRDRTRGRLQPSAL